LGSKYIGVTNLTNQGHATSSVTWPFDSLYTPLPIDGHLEQGSISNGFRDIQWRMRLDNHMTLNDL